MVRSVFSVVAAFSLTISCQGQAVHVPIRPAALHPGLYDERFTDAFSFTGNQGALGSSKGLMAGIYSERKWLLQELNLVAASLSLPLAAGGAGMQLLSFGSDQYNESTIGLAYGRSLGRLAYMGVQFNYHLVRISGYGQAGALNAEWGLILHPTASLSFGIHYYNPVGSKINAATTERIAAVFRSGFGLLVNGQMYLQFDFIKEENKPAGVDASLHLAFAGHLSAGLGIMTDAVSPYGWAGWSWNSLRLSISAAYQPPLGFSPGISLQYGNFSRIGENP